MDCGLVLRHHADPCVRNTTPDGFFDQKPHKFSTDPLIAVMWGDENVREFHFIICLSHPQLAVGDRNVRNKKPAIRIGIGEPFSKDCQGRSF